MNTSSLLFRPLATSHACFLALLALLWAGATAHPAPPGSLPGSLRRDVFRGIPGTFVTDLLESPLFPDSPAIRQLRTSFETPQNEGDNYGQIVYGWVTPAVTAQYRFLIASDDTAALYISTNEAPTRLQRIAFEPTAAAFRAYTTVDTRPNRENVSGYRRLEAGRSYFVLAISKEGRAGDGLSVAWETLGGTPIVNGAAPIPGSVLHYPTNATMLRTGPASVLIGPAPRSLQVGDTLVLSALAAGAPPLRYEWLRAGVAIPAPNSPVLTIPGVRTSHAGSYSVRVSNMEGTNSSTSVSVTVLSVPVVAGPVVNPGNSNRYYLLEHSSWTAAEEQSRALGGHLATVRNRAENTWIYNTFSTYGGFDRELWIGLRMTNFTPGLTDLTSSQIASRLGWSSDESASFRNWIPGEPNNFGGTEYLVSLRPPCCGGPGWNDWSDWGSWPVDGQDTRTKAFAVAEVPTNRLALPAITLQPVGQTNFPGSSVTLSVQATGAGSLRYQWEKDGWPLYGANLNQLSVSSLSNSDAGVYLVRVRNAGGTTVSATARIGVLPPAVPASITLNPVGQTLIAGSSATLFVVADGTAPIGYQWWRGTQLLPGQTASNLVFPSIQLGDAGTYSVVVSNVAGVVRSADAALTVLPPSAPPVIVKSGIVSTNIIAGQSLTLWVQASGTAPLSYQWWRGDQPMAGQTASNLVFQSIQPGDTGIYSVVVSNVVASIRSPDAVVTVTLAPELPRFVGSNLGPTNRSVGQPLILWVQAAGTAPLSYQWWRGSQIVPGQTASNLIFTSIQLDDAATYSVVASNLLGSVRSTEAAVSVAIPLDPPTLTDFPLDSVLVNAGQPLTLRAVAAGSAPLSFQWFRDAQPLGGVSASPDLVLNAAAAKDSGSYALQVSNPYGTIRSPEVKVQVVQPSTGGVGPVLFVHGHADSPALWLTQGSKLEEVSGHSRFYDHAYYTDRVMPQPFKANGLYGVTYYSHVPSGAIEPAPISPVKLGATELPPDNATSRSALFPAQDSYAARLAVIIKRAYADTGRKVTLVCHSMGGLVSVAAVTWFDCADKVEKIVTIGSPLQGFPNDFRVPLEVLGLGREALYREGLQMSEGTHYGGDSFSSRLESQFKLLKPAPPKVVSIIGSLSPFPDALLTGPNDGVVRVADQHFRDTSLSTVYPLPLTHIQSYKELQYPAQDVECLSSRTTDVLALEVLGIVPSLRISVSSYLDYGTGKLRLTIRNDGGVLVVFHEIAARFTLSGPAPVSTSKVLTELIGQTLAPGDQRELDGISLPRGAKGDLAIQLRVNGQELESGRPSWIANIQAPEIEASVRFDVLNSILLTEWEKAVGSSLVPVAWDARYLLEGHMGLDPATGHQVGRITGRFFAASASGAPGSTGREMFAESFDFDLDPITRIFSQTGSSVLDPRLLSPIGAASSRLRELYRKKLTALLESHATGDFRVEGQFTAKAGLKLPRPVFSYDASRRAPRIDVGGSLYFAFSEPDEDHVLEIPIRAECNARFITTEKGLMIRPQLHQLTVSGFSLDEGYRKQINDALDQLELYLAPAALKDGLNDKAYQAYMHTKYRSLDTDTVDRLHAPPSFQIFRTLTFGVGASPSGIRILVDLMDDSSYPDVNSPDPMPESGIRLQDRILNKLIVDLLPYINDAFRSNGENSSAIGFELSVPTGGWWDVAYYVDRAEFEGYTGGNEGRRSTIRFLGPENKTSVDVSLNVNFYTQIRFYLTFRIGFWDPFGNWYGYVKHEEVRGLRVNGKEILALDLDFNLYPSVTGSGLPRYATAPEVGLGAASSTINLRFPLEELGFDVNLNQGTLTPIPILAEVLVEPLFRFAKADNPVPAAMFGSLLGGLLAYVAPDAIAGKVMDSQATQALSSDNGDLGNLLGFKDGSGHFEFRTSAGAAIAPIGALAGFVGGVALYEALHQTIQTKATMTPPAGIRLTNLLISAGAASLFLDVDPIFGDVDVVGFDGLGAAREPISLSPDDVYFGQEDLGEHEAHPLHLVYRGEGLQRGFTTLWVKKNVNAIQLKCRLNTRFAGRYNSAAFPAYKVEYRDLSGGPFAVPAGYAYNADVDQGEFTLELPLLEGTGGLHAVRLTLPGPQSKTICFFVGKDTSPILINQPFAAYSAITSNVTIRAGTLGYWNATGPKPSFTLEALRILDLRDAVTTTSLLQPGIFGSTLVPAELTPAETRTPRLYGKTYQWTGRLPSNSFPDGVYTVLVTIKETAMNRRGSLLIPLIVDRTPPELAVWKSYDSQVVVSKHVGLPLEWTARDNGSAVLHDLYLTYAASGGASLTGAVLTTPGQVLPPGQRHLDFNVDYGRAADGPYTLQIHGTDVLGNRGASTNVSFIVDTQPPPLDSLFLYPATTGAYDSLLTRSNRLLTIKAQSREPFNARFMLTSAAGDTQSWYARSKRLPGVDGTHMSIWTLEIPEIDPDQGLLEGTLKDGLFQLSVELVDRGDNTNLVSNVRTLLIDRRPPAIAFKTQPPLVSAPAKTYPLDLDLSGLQPGDAITSIALVNLNGFTSSSSVETATLRSWTTASEINALRSGGVPLLLPPAGTPLPSGFYGIEVRAIDAAGNSSRIVTTFAYRLIAPVLEVAGGSPSHGIVTLLGVATDPNPADPFPFKGRELYWARGAGVPVPSNLGVIDSAIWKTAGLYVMPPHGTTSGVRDNESVEPVAKGTLGYWNTTAAGVVLAGSSSVTLSSAGLIDDDVTVMVVVRDQGGQAWAATTSTHIDNRAVDANALTAPQLQITQAAVQDHQLLVSAGMLSDAHSVQMVVLDPAGNPVHSESRGATPTSNGLVGKPTYSLGTDFGFFVWYDTNFSQLRIRCVAPEQDSTGNLLTTGHTFYFSVQGPFVTNDITSLHVTPDEQPRGGSLAILSNGDLRVMYALTVSAGDEKGINIAYHGGSLQFGALGIDEYAQAIYTSGTRVIRRFWRSDDATSVFPGYDTLSRIRNLAGLNGIVMRGSAPEFPDVRAIANHSGALGHVFTGRQRNTPSSPLGIQFDGPQLHPDFTLGWDLKLANGSLAAPGAYKVYVFSQREDGQGFNGALATVNVFPADVPLKLTGLTATGGGRFDPRADGSIVFGFLPSRTAQITVRVLDAARGPLATLLNGVVVNGGSDTNNPQRVAWEGYVDGKPVQAGDYSFSVEMTADGVTSTNQGPMFSVVYPGSLDRESDWGLFTQPISFDPDSRDRIVLDTDRNRAADQAWVTLHFDARLSDGTVSDAEIQVPLERQEGGFESSLTDPASMTYIPVGSLFNDAVQRLESVMVKYNGRVVDAFPAVDLPPVPSSSLPSRSGQFYFEVLDAGPKALRLQARLKATLKPWMTGVWPVLTELNQVFDQTQSREFIAEVEFREKPGSPGVLQSLPWKFRHQEHLWGYSTNGGKILPVFGWALLNEAVDLELEFRDRNGKKTLGRFEPGQVGMAQVSAGDQLFSTTGFSDLKPTDQVSLDFVFETSLTGLQQKSQALGVPVAVGYAGLNGWLQIPNTTEITDLADPFPTRYYHADGKQPDTFNAGKRYDDVKAYSGDSALVQEVTLTNATIAGHIPFEYSIRPIQQGAQGRQTIQMHPWVPFSFRKPVPSAVWTAGGISASRPAGDINRDGNPDLLMRSASTGAYGLILGTPGSPGLGAPSPSWVAGPSPFGEDQVISPGDIDGDGKGDLVQVVLLNRSFGFNGTIYFYELRCYRGTVAGAEPQPFRSIPVTLGDAGDSWTLVSAGDLNGDGLADVVIHSPGQGWNGNPTAGWIQIFKGGAAGLEYVTTLSDVGGFAESVAGIGDVDRDGYDDLLIGVDYFDHPAPVCCDPPGEARVYYGSGNLSFSRTWAVRSLLEEGYGKFGKVVARAGDVNGDGFPDFIVGAPDLGSLSPTPGSGVVRLFLGKANGLSTQYSLEFSGKAPENNVFSLGLALDSAGDVNADGLSDVYMTGWMNNQAWALVFLGSATTGLNPTPAYRLPIDHASTSLVPVGDLNKDGFADLLHVGINLVASVRYFPLGALDYVGWVRGGAGGGTSLPIYAETPSLDNRLPIPLANVVNSAENDLTVGVTYDPVSHRQVARVTYSSGFSGYVTNAPFPSSPDRATAWIATSMYDASKISTVALPVDPITGKTNSGWLVNLKFAAVTNDMLIAATPDAFDAVVRDAVVDYTHVPNADPRYSPTVNYVSAGPAWTILQPKLPSGALPAVDTTPEFRPRIAITNIILHPDPAFPSVSPDDLALQFEPLPGADGGAASYIKTHFDHRKGSGYFRKWSLAEDPNIQAAAIVQPEPVMVSITLSNYVYESISGALLTNKSVRVLVSDTSLNLVPLVTQSISSVPVTESSLSFKRFRLATLSITVTRPSTYSTTGEGETMDLINLDLSVATPSPVRSARYQATITPVINGARNNTVGWQLQLAVDPPVEFSTRAPLRRGDRIALPMKIIDREKFWQIDQGTYRANLFREVAVEQPGTSGSTPFGYLIDAERGFVMVNGRRPLATDLDYAQKQGALFWKTREGRAVLNPRIIPGDLSIVVKDPSNQEESPLFYDKRYILPTSDYFNDLYVDQKDVASLSWSIKIRPQAKEHAYVKVYGSVGGSWRLSYRPLRARTTPSGLLASDSETPTWTSLRTGSGRGQNQFLTYWDVTELNGPHILRLESAASPDNLSNQPEVRYLEVMLGQHLPGLNNPIFSPRGAASTVSLFSMHGRTQLTSAPNQRGSNDMFFTVNPMTIDEKPFSLPSNGSLPLGERVQVLPHTEHNPLGVSFYMDLAEFRLYDPFRLYHQLENGELTEITTLPPITTDNTALLLGLVDHTSIVGFLPNPALRLCTLTVPGRSPDGLIRISGNIDLYGKDAAGQQNERLAVAIVVSTNADFYAGRVLARLTAGAHGEFPTGAEAAQSLVASGWKPSMASRNDRVFAVVINPADDWLTLNRQLSQSDADQHLFNVSQSSVLMSTNLSGSLSVDAPAVFSPNGDGVADTINLRVDFARQGIVQLEIHNELDDIVHIASVQLDGGGKGSFVWDGLITGGGNPSLAPEGLYTFVARYADGLAAAETASVSVEVRKTSQYGGVLLAEGVSNVAGHWRTRWSHQGGVLHPLDKVYIEFSDSADFAVSHGTRTVGRDELSALFDDQPDNLGAFVADASGRFTVHYRTRVVDEVGNTGFSPVVAVSLPAAGKLEVVEVLPSNGSLNISTEPLIVIRFAQPCPFGPSELLGMLVTFPGVAVNLSLSADLRTLTAVPQASLPAGATVGCALQKFPGAALSDTFIWSFSVMPESLIRRTLAARVIGSPSQLLAPGASATPLVVVTNAGNVPARVVVTPASFGTNGVAVGLPLMPAWIAPGTEATVPVSLLSTGEFRGTLLLPMALSELTLGNWTSVWITASVSTRTSAPTVRVVTELVQGDLFSRHFEGVSKGGSIPTTLARINGGSWWVVSYAANWSVDVGFSAEGDVLDVMAVEDNRLYSAIYRYAFHGPPLELSMGLDRSLYWDAQLGRTYSLEWSEDLIHWKPVEGNALQNGMSLIISPGTNPVQIEDSVVGRVGITFSPNPESTLGTNAFLRVRSNR